MAQGRASGQTIAEVAGYRGCMWIRAVALWLAVVAALAPVPASAQQGETVDQALCRLIEGAAAAQRIPVAFFARLIWQESSFRPAATSPKGARGVAQFMPGTAAERGLADAYDPEQALPKSAELIAELRARFGNLGLAAAAYNGGPARVEAWLAGRGGLPGETRDYVSAITGRAADEWANDARAGRAEPEEETPTRCLVLIANVRRGTGTLMAAAAAPYEGPVADTPFTPWGVQIAGNFSKDRALATYARARQRFGDVLEDVTPMVIGTRLRFRGTRAFYRVRIPAATREAAGEICGRLRKSGGACGVLKS